MNVFNLFFGGGGKSLDINKLDKMLREVSAISSEEREYVKAVFNKYKSNGISEEEAISALSELKYNFSDNLDSSEVEKIKAQMLGCFV